MTDKTPIDVTSLVKLSLRRMVNTDVGVAFDRRYHAFLGPRGGYALLKCCTLVLGTVSSADKLSTNIGRSGVAAVKDINDLFPKQPQNRQFSETEESCTKPEDEHVIPQNGPG